MKPPNPASIFHRIRGIIESARAGAARSVNTAQVVSNWLIGREIVEDEQRGKQRAGYGERLMRGLATRLCASYGAGFSFRNLNYIRQFFLSYPHLLPPDQIVHAPRAQSSSLADFRLARGNSWKPGLLNPNLSWTHYRTLLHVEKSDIRAFYEIEAIKNSWSARELERQIASLLYERLALSRDKQGLMRLAAKGHEVQKPADVFKDPMVMEFLGLPESPKLVETKLEQALIGVPVANAEKPIEVLRVVHSFDPCLDCATHVTRAEPGAKVFALGELPTAG